MAQENGQYYFDTDDAFNFYKELWGGENVHIGIYPPGFEPSVEVVLEASHKSLDHMLDKMAPALTPRENGAGRRKVIDMGSAYGGCARAIATRFDCEVLCIELSGRENEINRARTKEQKLDHLVKCPAELSFLDTGAPSDSFDVVFSMDSLLHEGPKCMKEIARVLKPGGTVIFTDIMRSDGVPKAAFKDVFARVPGLETMGTPAAYVNAGTEHGLRLSGFEERTVDMVNHYSALHAVLSDAHEKGTLKGKISDGFILNMVKGLTAWIDQGSKKNLTWGVMTFVKPAEGINA
ncbi:hypothetical protein BSKO_11957 [Bryopsis sp. KO-2023]|nr:hypothetical protein BSKO_11957 [Bryopsis sp. KO-2023]